MNELYWITRIGAFENVICIVASISAMLFIISLIVLIADRENYNPDSEWGSDRRHASQYRMIIKLCKTSAIIACVTIIASVFVPSEKEMFLIYGGGKVMEFVKNDSIVKQLPHDAVEALHKYLNE